MRQREKRHAVKVDALETRVRIEDEVECQVPGLVCHQRDGCARQEKRGSFDAAIRRDADVRGGSLCLSGLRLGEHRRGRQER